MSSANERRTNHSRRRWMGIGLLAAVALTALFLVERGRKEEGDPHSIARPGDEAAVEGVATLRGAAGNDRGTTGAEAPLPRAGNVPDVARGVPLRGVVLDTDGHPLPIAAVFLLPKGIPGLDEPTARRTGLVRAFATEDGRFDLGRRDAKGHWIGAVAPGHFPSHLDGDALPAGEAELALAPGPALRVTVVGADDGPLTLDTTITAEPTGESWAWPAPERPWYFEAEGTIEEGTQEVVIRVGTKDEVEVIARYRNVMPIVEPDRLRVTPPSDVTFRVLISCVLDLRVLDGATQEPLDQGFHYWLQRDGVVVTGGSTSLAGGEMRVACRLEPGPYTARVEAVGYTPAEATVEGLVRPGDHATVEVVLVSDPTLGSLRMRIPLLAELPKIAGPEGRERAPPPFVLFRRPTALAPSFVQLMDPKDAPAWGRLMGRGHGESETDHVWEAVRSGVVTALVAEAASGTVAVIPDLRIPEGGSTSATAELRPGILVELAALAPGATEASSVTVRHALYGELPTYGATHASGHWADPGRPADPTWTIGPYPGPEIEITLRDQAGETKIHTVRLEDDAGR